VAANNRKFQEFIDRFAAESVSTNVRSLMWECWVAATEAVEAGEPTHNRQITPCERHSCCNCGNVSCPLNSVNCHKFVPRTA
jgi:hypothetical protein